MSTLSALSSTKNGFESQTIKKPFHVLMVTGIYPTDDPAYNSFIS